MESNRYVKMQARLCRGARPVNSENVSETAAFTLVQPRVRILLHAAGMPHGFGGQIREPLTARTRDA